MREVLGLFVSTFTTLLAIINPLEALPVYLSLLEGQSVDEQRKVAWKSCFYATMLLFFFLIFGTLMLRFFGVSMSMVRFVGGIVLLRIGFQLFSGSSSKESLVGKSGGPEQGNIAFVPLAMPIMFGPGAIATTLEMISEIRNSELEVATFLAVSLAILATMLVTYLCLLYARRISRRVGPLGIDAATRIVGFFVAAMGGGLAFRGAIGALREYGLAVTR